MMTTASEKLLLGLAVLFVAFLTAVILDYGLGSEEVQSCEVIEKRYVPATSSTGVGITPRGHTAVIFSSSAEEYLLIIRRDREVRSKRVDPDLYASASVGSMMPISFRRGRLSGALY